MICLIQSFSRAHHIRWFGSGVLEASFDEILQFFKLHQNDQIQINHIERTGEFLLVNRANILSGVVMERNEILFQNQEDALTAEQMMVNLAMELKE